MQASVGPLRPAWQPLTLETAVFLPREQAVARSPVTAGGLKTQSPGPPGRPLRACLARAQGQGSHPLMARVPLFPVIALLLLDLVGPICDEALREQN